MAKSGVGFAESVARSAEILEQLRGGVYAPVYLLHGTEGYFIDLIEDYISAHALPEELRAFNQITLWGKESSAGEVQSAARQYPMMGGRTVVVVRDAQHLKGLEELASYVAAPMASTVLVLCHREKAVDKRSVFYKKCAAQKEAVVFESIEPREWEVAGFVERLLAQKGLAAENGVVPMLADHIGTDLRRIDTELTKLATRLPSGSTKITATDVEQNVGISKQFNNFELNKALSVRDFKKALRIADHFARDPKNNPLVVTLSMLFTHFQRIATLNLHKWECQRARKPVGSEWDLAKLLGLSNAFFVGEYQTASANYPTAKAVEILGLVRTWDMKAKGFGGGGASDGELLRELILRISMI